MKISPRYHADKERQNSNSNWRWQFFTNQIILEKDEGRKDKKWHYLEWQECTYWTISQMSGGDTNRFSHFWRQLSNLLKVHISSGLATQFLEIHPWGKSIPIGNLPLETPFVEAKQKHS